MKRSWLLTALVFCISAPALSQELVTVLLHHPTQVATPTFDPDGGSAASFSVTIADTTSGAAIIYCTAVGSDCNPVGGTTYTVPVSITVTATHLCAYATHDGMTASATHCATYTITGGAAWSQVQVKAFGATTGDDTPSVTFDSQPVQGHLLLLAVAADDAINAVGTWTSTGWTQVNYNIDWTGNGLYCKIAGASESSTITIGIGSATGSSMVALELSGNASDACSAVDRTTAQIGQGPTAFATGATAATTFGNDLVVAMVGSPGSGGWTESTGWDNSFVDVVTPFVSTQSTIGIAVASKVVSVTGAQSATLTMADTGIAHGGAIIAAFKGQ